MTREGVDYSAGRPDLNALKAAGKTFVMRYLTTYTSQPKMVSRAELDALRAAGLDVMLGFEDYADNATRGFAQGVKDAQVSDQQCNDLGVPGSVVYMAVDYDVQPGAQLSTMLDYLRGCNSVIGVQRTGVYGGLRAVSSAADAGVAGWLWQTYAWSYGKWDPRVNVRQHLNNVTVAGASVDLDTAMTDPFGQIGAEIDMPTTPADAKVTADFLISYTPFHDFIQQAVQASNVGVMRSGEQAQIIANAAQQGAQAAGVGIMRSTEQGQILARAAQQGAQAALSTASPSSQWQSAISDAVVKALPPAGTGGQADAATVTAAVLKVIADAIAHEVQPVVAAESTEQVEQASPAHSVPAEGGQ